jgi:hypothetical protein
VLVHESHVVAVAGAQRLDHLEAAGAVRALEVGVFHERVLGAGRAAEAGLRGEHRGLALAEGLLDGILLAALRQLLLGLDEQVQQLELLLAERFQQDVGVVAQELADVFA